MKKILYSLLFLFILACNKSDNDTGKIELDQNNVENPDEESPDLGEEQELTINVEFNLKGLPLQIFDINLNDLPGAEKDYKFIIEAEELDIHELTDNGFKIVIPLNITIGQKQLSLVYRNKNYNLGFIEIITPVEALGTETVVYETDNEINPVIIIDKNNTLFVPQIVDGVLDGVAITTQNKQETYLQINELKLPKIISNDEISLFFDNYDFDNRKVDMVYVLNGEYGNPIYHKDLPLSYEFIELYNSSRSSKSVYNQDVVDEILKFVGLSLSAVSCALAIVGSVAVITSVLAALKCTMFAIDLAIYLNPDWERTIASYIYTVFTIKMSTIDCLKAVSTPKGILNAINECKSLIYEHAKALKLLYDEVTKSNTDAIGELFISLSGNFYIIESLKRGGDDTIFVGGETTFSIKNISSESISIISAQTPEGFTFVILNPILISGNERRTFSTNFYPERLGTYSGSIVLNMSNGEKINIKIFPIHVIPWPRDYFSGGHEVSNTQFCNTNVTFVEDGSIITDCPGSSCELTGSWSVNGIQISFEYTTKITSILNDGSEHVESYSSEFTGSMVHRSQAVGNMTCSRPNGSHTTSNAILSL